MKKLLCDCSIVAKPRRSGPACVVIVATLMFGCEGFFADDQVFSDRVNKSSSSIKTKAFTAPGPAQLLASGLQVSYGSTVGPGGDLFVPEGEAGRISRVDPETGEVTTYAVGLPPATFGGVMDVAFLGGTAYALVTLVGPQFGTTDVVGIYRVDGPDSFTVIADIGAFAIANPPTTSFFVETGVQYSFETYRGAFLVTDGHHNRVLHVTRDGEISEIKTFGNVVPTGLAVSGNTAYVSQAGPTPHLPQDGKIVSFDPQSSSVTTVASGARLLVDVEFGLGKTMFGLSQGVWDGVAEGTPAEPNTGSLVRVNADGTFTTIASGLDRPTSLEIIGNTAYVITLTGQVWTIENIAAPPFGEYGN